MRRSAQPCDPTRTWWYPTENWVLVAPDSPEVSAAPGFSRRYDDGGQPVYSLIRPRFIKDVLGNTRLAQYGRLIHCVKGLRTWAG